MKTSLSDPFSALQFCPKWEANLYVKRSILVLMFKTHTFQYIFQNS